MIQSILFVWVCYIVTHTGLTINVEYDFFHMFCFRVHKLSYMYHMRTTVIKEGMDVIAWVYIFILLAYSEKEKWKGGKKTKVVVLLARIV